MDISDLKAYLSTHSIEEYLEHHWPIATARDPISLKSRQAVLKMLHRMDSIPRDHSFWGGTNRLVNIHKVTRIARFVLQETPDDIDAAWALVGIAIHWSTNDLGVPILIDLYKANPFDPAALILMAHRHAVSSGANSAAPLLAFFEGCGLMPDLQVHIERALLDGDPGLADWVHKNLPMAKLQADPVSQ